jgi:hypothetical protein
MAGSNASCNDEIYLFSNDRAVGATHDRYLLEVTVPTRLQEVKPILRLYANTIPSVEDTSRQTFAR